MEEDWGEESGSGYISSKMDSLTVSNPGISIGRGRGLKMGAQVNGDVGFGNYSSNNSNGYNCSSNNNDDDWAEDTVTTSSYSNNNINSYSNDSYGNSKSSGGRGKNFGNRSKKVSNSIKTSAKGKKAGRGCFNCGESGHMSRECPQPKKNGGGKGCFKCGEDGHISRDCPSGGGGGGGNRGCFKCGEDGHISRDCPSGGGSGGSGNRGCFKCGEDGHISRDCPSGGGSGGSGNRGCFKCGEDGHISRDCPSGGGGGSGNRACFKCGEEGHMSRDCPSGGGGGGGDRGRGCFKCGQDGHMAKDCSEPGDANPDKPPASTYEPEEIPNDEQHLFERGINSGIHFDKYDNIPVKMSGNNLVKAIKSFKDARFTELLEDNIKRAHYIKPTPIQKCAIPVILQGRDLMGCAQTGSGKTAAFLLPMIEYMLREKVTEAEYKTVQEPTVIIVAPTRELALQIHNEARKFAYKTDIRSVVVYGGTAVNFQLSNLMNGCHILVATPGRLGDFINRRKINFDKLKFLVLDEADRMLDMGFISDVKKFCAHAASSSVGLQTLMFSATFPAEVQQLAGEFLNNYLFLAIGQVGGANSDVKQTVYEVGQFEKRTKLVSILQESPNDRTLVFVEKKRTADFLATFLCQENLRTTSIHGDRPQREREEALADFRSGRMPILTATAVAARGLDIKGVQHVINYDMPKSVDEYVHRIGRTGRVGNEGKATSFYDASADSQIAPSLIKILSDSMQEVPDWLQSQSSGISMPSAGGVGRGGFGARDVRSKAGGDSNPFGQSTGMQAVLTSAPDDEEWD